MDAEELSRGISAVGLQHHLADRSLAELKADLREAAQTVGAQLA
jgi:hypothetical protein